MKFRPFALSFLLILSGCSSGISYSYSPDLGNIYRNPSSHGDSYSTLLLEGKSETISSLLERGETALLFLTSTSCSHCLDLEEAMKGFVKETKLEIHCLQDQGIRTEILALQKDYPFLSSLLPRYGTPCAVALTKEAYSPIPLSGLSQKEIAKAIFEKVNYTPVSRYTTLASFAEFHSKGEMFYCTSIQDPSYPSFYRDSGIFQTKKPFGVLDASNWSKEDYQLFEENYSEFQEGALFFGEEKAPYESKEGQEMLKDYLS